MNVLITGADGFIGKNLKLRLSEFPDLKISIFVRNGSQADLFDLVARADFIFHLAGINRTQDSSEFAKGNTALTQALCNALDDRATAGAPPIPVVYTSSTQAQQKNAYGQSKLEAERILLSTSERLGLPLSVFRLPNVFGKWCKPNYNSAVATFCHNISRGLPVEIHNESTLLTLVYIDDVVSAFTSIMQGRSALVDEEGYAQVEPRYQSTVGEVVRKIEGFHRDRTSLSVARVGEGFERALYATYLSFVPQSDFAYNIPMHADARGVFVEMLKTRDSGQFSFFTAGPGITRGGHYHNTKTEKFLVIRGKARFKFKNMASAETHELDTSGDKSMIVDTVPGWSHDITNIGNEDMIVMLWANEVFDRERPDTYFCPL
jgi:UDP-2-acetamido-2,6-beta-L-arabino-hexul-4-ose reductase